MLKKVLIIYTGSDKNIEERPPFNSQKTGSQIERLFVEGEKRGIKFLRAPICLFDSRNKLFTKAWSFAEGKWSVINNVVPDIIFDKCQYYPNLIAKKSRIASVYKYVNDPAFDEIASNKVLSYYLLKEWMPDTYLVYGKKDLEEKLIRIRSEKFVLKPLCGNEGRGVKILAKDKWNKLNIRKTSVLQEFIDSSRGIKNIVNDRHDLRIIIFNDEIFGSYIRIPKKGSLLANLAKGGGRIIIEKSKIPKRALGIAQKVIEKFSSLDNLFYCVDFIFDKDQRPYILEINPRPGFSIENVHDRETKKFYDEYYERMIRFFIEM